jgi:hypothetical protein
LLPSKAEPDESQIPIDCPSRQIIYQTPLSRQNGRNMKESTMTAYRFLLLISLMAAVLTLGFSQPVQAASQDSLRRQYPLKLESGLTLRAVAPGQNTTIRTRIINPNDSPKPLSLTIFVDGYGWGGSSQPIFNQTLYTYQVDCNVNFGTGPHGGCYYTFRGTLGSNTSANFNLNVNAGQNTGFYRMTKISLKQLSGLPTVRGYGITIR